MYKKYYKTFEFMDTIEQARAFCDSRNASATAYMRRNHPAHFTPWISKNGSKQKFVCWYYH